MYAVTTETFLSSGVRRASISNEALVFWSAVAGAATVAAALTSFHLDDRSLTFDEAVTVAYARLSPLDLLHALRLGDAFFGVYYAMMHYWLHFGPREGILRSFSVLCAVGAVVVIALFARKVAGVRVAIVAAVLAAFSPTLFDLAQQARPYSLLALVATASSLALIDAADRPRLAAWLRYVLVTAFGCYVHLFMLGLVVAHAVWVTACRRNLWRAGFAPAVVTVGIATTPLLVLLHGYPAVNAFIVRPSPHSLIETFYWFFGSRALAIVAIAASIVAVAVSWRARSAFSRDLVALLVLWGCVPPLLAFAASELVKPMYTHRYFAEAWPAYVVGLALLVARLPLPAMLLAVTVIAVADLATIVPAHLQVMQDWRGASTIILSEARPNDAIVVYPDRGVIPYDYYIRELGISGPVKIYPNEEQFPLLQTTAGPAFWSRPAALPDSTGRYRRIWFLIGWNEDERSLRGVRVLVPSLPAGFHLASRVHLTHETVLRFDRSSARGIGTARETEHLVGSLQL